MLTWKILTIQTNQKLPGQLHFKGYKGEPQKYVSQKNITLKLHLTVICILLLSKRTKNLLVRVSLQPEINFVNERTHFLWLLESWTRSSGNIWSSAIPPMTTRAPKRRPPPRMTPDQRSHRPTTPATMTTPRRNIH